MVRSLFREEVWGGRRWKGRETGGGLEFLRHKIRFKGDARGLDVNGNSSKGETWEVLKVLNVRCDGALKRL